MQLQPGYPEETDGKGVQGDKAIRNRIGKEEGMKDLDAVWEMGVPEVAESNVSFHRSRA